MTFEILKQEGFSRRGRLHLHHGTVETPVFMPVGTHGVVKTMATHELLEVGSQIILGNTYHLNLRPGMKVLKQMGGLHRFMKWEKPILTDSGGFQIFSLGKKKLTEDGVTFQSHLNGDKIFLSPENCAEIQQIIGSDIAMVLDELVALPNTKEALNDAVDRSFRWAKRFLAVPKLETQKTFGIVQGGTDPELRLKSLELTASLPFDGLAVGGLSVGEPFNEMVRTLETLAPGLPPQLPHYLMGVGTPLDLLVGVRNGIDMFDCVMPTRNARNGGLFSDQGLINIRNQIHQMDDSPLVGGCECETCQNHSRGYLRHLFNIREILGCRLATTHNLHYYHGLMSRIRKALEGGTFDDLYQSLYPQLKTAYGKNIGD